MSNLSKEQLNEVKKRRLGLEYFISHPKLAAGLIARWGVVAKRRDILIELLEVEATHGVKVYNPKPLTLSDQAELEERENNRKEEVRVSKAASRNAGSRFLDRSPIKPKAEQNSLPEETASIIKEIRTELQKEKPKLLRFLDTEREFNDLPKSNQKMLNEAKTIWAALSESDKKAKHGKGSQRAIAAKIKKNLILSQGVETIRGIITRKPNQKFWKT